MAQHVEHQECFLTPENKQLSHVRLHVACHVMMLTQTDVCVGTCPLYILDAGSGVGTHLGSDSHGSPCGAGVSGQIRCVRRTFFSDV